MLRTQTTFWALLALELMNLYILSWISEMASVLAFIFTLTFQVVETVILLLLFLVNSMEWQAMNTMAWTI